MYIRVLRLFLFSSTDFHFFLVAYGISKLIKFFDALLETIVFSLSIIYHVNWLIE